MSFESLAQQITNELLTDLKTHLGLKIDRAQITDRWRALILAAFTRDAQEVLERYYAQGLNSQEARESAADKLRKLIEKESG